MLTKEDIESIIDGQGCRVVYKRVHRYSYYASDRVVIRVLAEKQRGHRVYIGTLSSLLSMSDEQLRSHTLAKLAAKAGIVEAGT